MGNDILPSGNRNEARVPGPSARWEGRGPEQGPAPATGGAPATPFAPWALHGHSKARAGRSGLAGAPLGALRSLVSAALVGLIRFYQQALSPLFPHTCRYWPTCSEYSIQAIRKHGPLKGLALAAWREGVAAENPPGGYDPVP